MDVTLEHAVRTEYRLQAVLRASTLRRHPGEWAYEPFPTPHLQARLRTDALALVQNGYGWSQLAPVRAGEVPEEPMVLWSFHFPPDAPNSGFVGWLASLIKERTGSGVIVVCGYDAERGGVYDHWGCPASAADEVLKVIGDLRQPPASAADRRPEVQPPALSLDQRFMNAIVTAEAGVIDADTLFHFRQDGARVWARYAGGRVADANLMGTLDGEKLHFRYVQRQTDGAVDGGESNCVVERLADGRLQIRERFEWASRDGSGENILCELP